MTALSVPEFVSRWQRATLTERSGSHEHFIGLCNILSQPTLLQLNAERAGKP